MSRLYRSFSALVVVGLLALGFAACTSSPDEELAGDARATTPGDATSSPSTSYPCAADASWVSNPDPPDEIPGGGTDFCQFYQFGWQWFLYLGSPGAGGDRNFQDLAAYPEWEAKTDSCDGDHVGHSLFVRDVKDDDSDAASDVIIPDRTGQAGSGAVIYDQNSNVVYYNVQFDQGLCDAATTGDLPAGTTEIKTSWRVMDDDDSGYFTWTVSIDGVNGGDPVDLGLVGFHLFRTTADHPEGLWITWEHKSNAPTCSDPQTAPAGGWSFASANCAACLAGEGNDCSACDFNEVTAGSTEPTEICQFYPNGTAPGDDKADENNQVVDELNDELVGADGILTQLASSNPMAVWANYQNVGGLWVSDPTQPASSSNQRGSLNLANTTMETTFQGGPNSSTLLNCFDCHTYTPNQTATSGLSHIFSTIHGPSGSEQAAISDAADHLRFVRARSVDRDDRVAGGE